MRRALALIVFLLACSTGVIAAPNLAGTVDFIEGDVRVVKADKSVVVPKAGDPLYETDSVITGADGEVHFKMEDSGYLAVRPNTKMRIAQFQANGEANDRSVLGLLEGSLRSITGWIGKYNSNGYQIRAKNATIGIRGTDHEPYVRLRDDAEGEAGIYDRVNAGGTFIRTGQGRVEVGPGKAGFWSPTKRVAPRVLDRVPAFYRPTRNEGRLEGLHQRIQSSLEQRREERRSFLRSRASASARSATREAQAGEGQARAERKATREAQKEKALQSGNKNAAEKREAAKEIAPENAQHAGAKAKGKGKAHVPEKKPDAAEHEKKK